MASVSLIGIRYRENYKNNNDIVMTIVSVLESYSRLVRHSNNNIRVMMMMMMMIMNETMNGLPARIDQLDRSDLIYERTHCT